MKWWKARWTSVLLTLILLLSLVPVASAQSSQGGEKELTQLLNAYVGELTMNPNSEGMIAGYAVYSLDDGKMVASYNGEKTFVPASVFKLLVTATAASKLPKDLTIPTKVFVNGNISNDGVLNGDIFLKGYGDPTLTVEKLDTLAKSLADQGIHKVNGDIVVDESYFDDQRLGDNWMWDDEPYSYNTQMSALSVRENTVDVTVHAGDAVGDPAKITINPAPEYVKVVNKATTVPGSGRALSIDRTLGKNEIVVSGIIGENYSASGYKVTRTIVDPAPFTGEVFKDLLLDHGITFQKISTITKGVVDKNAELAAEVDSPKLDDILTEMDKESDNFYAEMLTKQLGAKFKGEGSTAAGIKVIRDFLVNTLGMDDSFIEKDGSGLTRLDHISPNSYIQLLSAIYKSPARDRFISFLPIAGVDGTLKNRMKNTPAAGNVKAKTGSMSGVNSLVGYVTTADGKAFAFSILSNGIYKSAYATNLQNEIAVALAKYPNLPAPPTVPAPEDTHYPLASQFDSILDNPAFNGLIEGAMIYSTKQHKVLYARNPKALLTPGASVKLLTTASALTNLGSDYRFKTEIYTTGQVVDGVLEGNVIVKGYGDPTLASDSNHQELDGPTLEAMAKDIKAAGIHLIKGNIIVDSGFFTDDVYAPGWTWDHESDAIQPQITALSVNRGTVRLNYEPGNVGKKINVSLEPNVDEIKVVNTAVTSAAGSANTLKIIRLRGENTIEVSGSLPADAKKGYKDVAVHAPQLYTGYVLKDQLNQAGVKVSPLSDVVNAPVPDDATLLKTYQSTVLSRIVSFMNHQNDNFTAEMVIRTLGTLNYGSGTFDEGIETVHQLMDTIIPTKFDMMDGSGLTKYTQISAGQITQLLAAEAEKPIFNDFYATLANASEDGLLKDNLGCLSSSQLTGIMETRSDIPGLSGYIKTEDGDVLAYSLVLNGYSKTPQTQLVQDFAKKLVDIASGSVVP